MQTTHVLLPRSHLQGEDQIVPPEVYIIFVLLKTPKTVRVGPGSVAVVPNYITGDFTKMVMGEDSSRPVDLVYR